MHYKKLETLQKIQELKPLLDLSSPPHELYYAGKWNPEIFKNCTAVIGSRRMTDYGASAVEKILPALCNQKRTIVSGFMYGIDQYAHKVTVENGGKTIAVLGWGINTPLSGQDLKLAGQIIDSGGMILSEWEMMKAALWTFPARNRIVAALSEEIIVVEAAEKSGSLITAAIASKLKRKVWAIPGPITSRTSRGTNQLIAKGLAQMWLDGPCQILPENQNPILDILINEALSADEIARKLNLPVSSAGAELSILLLSGQILEKGGKYYIANAN